MIWIHHKGYIIYIFNYYFLILFISLPTIFWKLQKVQTCKPVVVKIGFWDLVRALAHGYDYVMGLLIFTPIAVLGLFPFFWEFQTSFLFNQAFNKGPQISPILVHIYHIGWWKEAKLIWVHICNRKQILHFDIKVFLISNKYYFKKIIF